MVSQQKGEVVARRIECGLQFDRLSVRRFGLSVPGEVILE